MSNSLVFLSKNNLPLTTSLIIAEALERKHKFIIELIRNHEDDLNAVCGRVTFQTAPFATAGGTQNREIAFLNEQQTTLLITFMTNSPKVVKFKIALVKAFYEMRQALAQQTQTYTPDEIAVIKDKALKQGYAIACAQLKERVKPEEAEPKEAPSAKMLKDDEIAIPKATAKHIYEYLDWISKHRKEMMQTAEDMREQSRTLMYMAECYDVLRAGVKNVIFKKL